MEYVVAALNFVASIFLIGYRLSQSMLKLSRQLKPKWWLSLQESNSDQTDLFQALRNNGSFIELHGCIEGAGEKIRGIVASKPIVPRES